MRDFKIYANMCMNKFKFNEKERFPLCKTYKPNVVYN